MTVEARSAASSTKPAGSRGASGAKSLRAEGPADTALRDAARAAARLSKVLEGALSDTGLSLPQYRLLAFLSGGPERATALADWLRVSPPTLTALVDGAVNKRLVERTAAEGDRRCVRHELTQPGQEALDRADRALATRLAALTAHLDADEAAAAVRGLQLVATALDSEREAGER